MNPKLLISSAVLVASAVAFVWVDTASTQFDSFLSFELGAGLLVLLGSLFTLGVESSAMRAATRPIAHAPRARAAAASALPHLLPPTRPARAYIVPRRAALLRA